MKVVFVLAVFALVYHPCSSRAVESESVVSVYTTQATTDGTVGKHDVYRQIADNIAEKITSPIYRFLGYNKDKDITTHKPWDNLELLDESSEESAHPDIPPVENDISNNKDTEELALDALKKIDKKPEKFTLYSSYLPAAEVNVTTTTEEDPFEFLDDEEEKPRQNQFLYMLELLSSVLQLVWGGIVSYFRPSSTETV